MPAKVFHAEMLGSDVSTTVIAALAIVTAASTGRAAAPKLQIEWREAAAYPHILNGGMVGRVDGWVVYACGFGRRAKGVEKVDGYTRHAMAYEIAANRWARVPDFPGTARAYGTASGLHADGWTYVLGGQSYAPPYVYKDGWRIGRKGARWAWEKLPDLPFASAEFGACIVGRQLYLQGGAFYGRVDDKPATGHWCTVTGDVGQKLAVLDLSKTNQAWSMLPPLPGVGRNHHVRAAAGGKLYVLGGIAAIPKKGGQPWERENYCVTDNWKFDLATRRWRRLADLPMPVGGHASLVYRDRWVLLIGGYSARKILTVEGKVIEPFGPVKGFEDRIMVYDTKTNAFGQATPMPHAINDPRPVWIDDGVMFIATGEIPKSRRIPNCQVGRIRQQSKP